MSGDQPIVLISQPEGPLVRLLQGLAAVEQAGLGAHALIGGVAVMIRLAGQHRATADLDEVVAPTDPSAQVLLGAPPGTVQRVMLPGELKVDVIEVGETPLGDLEPSELPVDPVERLFLLAHDNALRSAQLVQLSVRDSSGNLLLEMAASVATPAALFATKLQSAPSRTGMSAPKRGSDLLDALLLLERYGQAEVSARLRAGPHDLAALVSALTLQLLDVEALRSLRWIREAGQEPDLHALSLGQVRAVAVALSAALIR